MKRFVKIAALVLTFSTVAAGLLGCRSESKMTEQINVVKSGIEKTRALESGEIMVYATFRTEHDIDERLQTSVTESYAKFLNDDALEFDFTETRKFASGDDMKTFEATAENGTTVVKRDGESLDASEAPDIFEAFSIDYVVADIDKIEVIDVGGQMLYTVTMRSDYNTKECYSNDGVDYNCKGVRFNYYLDAAGIVRKVLSEHTYEVICDGDTQTVVSFSQTTVN